jgi:hypothetical protein
MIFRGAVIDMVCVCGQQKGVAALNGENFIVANDCTSPRNYVL